MKIMVCLVGAGFAILAMPAASQVSGSQAAQVAESSRAAASVRTFNENVRGVYAPFPGSGGEVDKDKVRYEQRMARYRAKNAKPAAGN